MGDKYTPKVPTPYSLPEEEEENNGTSANTEEPPTAPRELETPGSQYENGVEQDIHPYGIGSES